MAGTIDVRLPDGTIVRNVPEGTTRAQIMAKMGGGQGTGLADAIRNTTASVTTNARNAPNPRWDLSKPPAPARDASSAADIVSGYGGALWRGPALGLDMLAAGGEAVGNGIQSVLSEAAGAGLHQAGFPNAGAKARRYLAPRKERGLRLAEIPDRLGTPRLTAPGLEPMLNLIGSMALPLPGGVKPELGPAVRQTANGWESTLRLPRGLQAPVPTPGRSLARAGARTPTGGAPTAPAAQAGQGLSRAELARMARLKAAGVQNPTLGMVTRNPAAWTAERELAKNTTVGGDVQAALQNAYRQLGEGANELVQRQGGAIGPEASGKTAQAALEAKSREMQTEIGALYKNVQSEFGGARVPKLENLQASQAHPDWWGNAEFDNMAASINKRLANIADADNGASGLTVKQAEELRKFIGNLGADSRQTYAMRKVFQDALDTDVLDGFGGKPYADARSAAKARFDEFQNTLAGKVAESGVPESIPQMLMRPSTGLNDTRAFVRSLTTGTPKQAAEGSSALQNIRAQVLDDIFGRSIVHDGPNTVVRGSKLHDEIMRSADKLKVILDPKGYSDLMNYAKAARDATWQPNLSYVNNSNTASTLTNQADRIAAMFPEITAPKVALRDALARRGSSIAGGTIGAYLGGPLGAGVGAEAGSRLTASIDARITRQAEEAMAQQAREQIRLLLDPALVDSRLALAPRAPVPQSAGGQRLPPLIIANPASYPIRAAPVVANELSPIVSRMVAPRLAADPEKQRKRRK